MIDVYANRLRQTSDATGKAPLRVTIRRAGDRLCRGASDVRWPS